MTKAIIFDLDGTLIDSCAVCIELLKTMIADRGFNVPIEPDHARLFMSRGGEKMVASLLGDAGRNAANDLSEFRERYRQTVTSPSALFEGVKVGLHDLHERGFELAICSNKPQFLCDKTLADTGILQYFTAIIGMSDQLRSKPAPDLLDATLSAMGRPASDCVFVGDSELDYLVAAEAQMHFYFLTYGYAAKGWIPPQGQVFSQFPPLANALTQLQLETVS